MTEEFIEIAQDLDETGLVWNPEIGDEVAKRIEPLSVSILVDPQGLTPKELRHMFFWLPTVEQLITQFEARQALIYHAGVNPSMKYETVIQTGEGLIETSARTLRLAFGRALRQLLLKASTQDLH